MSVHLTEEEQLENLKRWWKDYGKLVIAAVVICVAGYFAVTGWQDHKRQQAEQASASFEQLIKLMAPESGQAMSDADRAAATELATELKESSNSMYAHASALFLAKLAVEANKLDEAAAELNWVLSAKPDAATGYIARLRLARVLLAQQAYDKALAQLADEPAAAFAAEYNEVRGDALKAQGNLDAARTAYEKALAATNPQQQERHMLLQMKVNDLKVAEAPAADASGESNQ